MRVINVRVVPRSGKVKVSEEAGVFKVHLTRPAQDGEANEQLIEVLANHFGTKKYLISIIKGQSSRSKLVRLDDGT